MYYKTMLLHNSGVISKNEYISEGIRFFKTSNTLRKITNKISVALVSDDKTDPKDKKIVKDLLSKIENIRDKLEILENEYEEALNSNDKVNKEKLKEKYDKLLKDNKEIVSLLNKERAMKIVSGFLGIGLLVILIGSIFTVGNNFSFLFDNTKYWDIGGQKIAEELVAATIGASATGSIIGLISLIKKIKPSNNDTRKFLNNAKKTIEEEKQNAI